MRFLDKREKIVLTYRYMKKKLTIAILTVAILASVCFVFTACGAEPEVKYDYLSFSLVDGKLSVKVKSVAGMPVNLVIPSEYYADDDNSHSNKIAVASVADGGFENCDKLVSVTLPELDGDSFKSIGKNAFAGCLSLSSINLAGAENIGEGAFKNCKGLKSVSLSSGLTKLSKDVFSGCSSLTAVSGGSINEIGDNAFKSCLLLKDFSLNISSLTSVGSNVFFFTGGISNIKLPSTCTYVGAYAFCGWTKYQKIEYSNASGFDPLWAADCDAVFDPKLS